MSEDEQILTSPITPVNMVLQWRILDDWNGERENKNIDYRRGGLE